MFQKILVRATNWVGDAVMSLPALQALRDVYPDARISILAKPWVADLYEREPFCDEVIPYNTPRGWKGLREKWTIASELRRRHFDCAILLPNSFESAALVRLACIPIRIGYSRDSRGWMLTHPIPLPRSGEIPRHQRFYYLELLKRAAVVQDYSQTQSIRLHGVQIAAQKGREAFRKLSIPGAVVGISPGAAYGGAKRWLPERFAEAAAQIAERNPVSFALFGSEKEREICDVVAGELTARRQNAINLAGRTHLAQIHRVCRRV